MSWQSLTPLRSDQCGDVLGKAHLLDGFLLAMPNVCGIEELHIDVSAYKQEIRLLDV